MQAMVRNTVSSETPIGSRAALHNGLERIYAGIPKGKAFTAITPVWLLGLLMRIGGSFFG